MTGKTDTLAALDLPFDEAIAFLADKSNVTSTGWTDVWQRANAKAFTVAGAKTQALVEDFRAETAKAFEQGTTLAEFRKSFDEIVRKHGWAHVGTPGWRSRVIYETNLSMAYSAGRYAQQTEPETLAAFPYWQYVHSGARHPRIQHQAWNGMVLRADDPFWDWAYPPNGWGCGCRVRPLSEAGLKRQGRRGVDQAPARIPTETVTRAGEVLKGSAGVDPGFDYNPGQVWKNDLTGTPANTTPPMTATPDSLRTFIGDVLGGAIRKPGDSLVVGTLPPALVDAIGGGRSAVELSAFRVMKVAGRAAEMGGNASTPHPEITPDDWGRLPRILREGDVHLDAAQRGRHRQLIFHWTDPVDLHRQIMLIVRRVPRPGGGSRLVIPNFEQTGTRRRRRVTANLPVVER